MSGMRVQAHEDCTGSELVAEPVAEVAINLFDDVQATTWRLILVLPPQMEAAARPSSVFADPRLTHE